MIRFTVYQYNYFNEVDNEELMVLADDDYKIIINR